jgi:flagellar basal-body rod modification protein FlgD
MSIMAAQGTNGLSAASNQSTASTQGTGQTSSTGKLDMNAFLTMFLTQLKYQDPTNPLESYELAAQLAQFSSVEKLTEANSNLVDLQSYLSSLNNAEMVGLVGKHVVGQASTLQVSSGKATTADYQLDVPANNVSVKIYDENNALVRTMSMGAQAAGKYQINWDGCNDAGKNVSDGLYSFKLEAVDGNGNQLDVTPTISGLVYSFRLEQGNAYLILNGPGGIKLLAGDVMEVSAS